MASRPRGPRAPFQDWHPVLRWPLALALVSLSATLLVLLFRPRPQPFSVHDATLVVCMAVISAAAGAAFAVPRVRTFRIASGLVGSLMLARTVEAFISRPADVSLRSVIGTALLTTVAITLPTLGYALFGPWEPGSGPEAGGGQ